MSDKAMETGKLTSETPGTPNPEFLQEGADSSPGNSDKQLSVLIEKLVGDPRLMEAVKKVAYSEKDKGIARANRTADKALTATESMRAGIERFNTYVKRFGSEEAAYAELERDAKIEQALGGKESVQEPVSAGADTRPWGVRQNEILESAGIAADSKEILDFAKSQKWESPEKYLDALKAKTFELAVTDPTKPKPDSSNVANLAKGSTPITDFTGQDSDEIGAKIESLSMDYSANEVEIGALIKELESRDKGS